MSRCLILAAGRGRRLHPLTEHHPKCLVPFLGTNILQNQLNTLHEVGISDVHVVAGYKSEGIRQLGIPHSINERYAETNMVYSLFSAADFIIEDDARDLVIAYGDIVYEPRVLTAVMNSTAEIAVIADEDWLRLWSARMDDPLLDAETLVLDEDKNVIEIGNTPCDYDKIQGQYIGLIKVRSDMLKPLINFYRKLRHKSIHMIGDFENMQMTAFIQLLIDSDWEVRAVPVNSGWLEVDTVSDLNLYEYLNSQNSLCDFYKITK